MKDGELPTDEILNDVVEVCSDKKNRPLTDHVTAGAPDLVNYDAVVQYWISNNKVSVLGTTQGQIEQAYQDYLKWQKEKMGRDVDLSELIARLKEAGAHRVSVSSTMYIEVGKGEVARENVTSLTFGGLVDD